MGTYKLQIATGSDLVAGTCNDVSIILVGKLGESDKHQLPHHWSNFKAKAVAEFEIDVKRDLGELLLICLSTECYKIFSMDAWYCRYVNVTSSTGQFYQFPVYQWFLTSNTLDIAEGKGGLLSEKTHPLLCEQREAELVKKRNIYRWKLYEEGAPECMDVTYPNELPPTEQFSFKKQKSFRDCTQTRSSEMMIHGFLTCQDSWTDLEDIKHVSFIKQTSNLKVVADIWKEDSFFGYQYLNGANPVLIKKCSKIPENFPVTDSMVAHSLGTCISLQEEIQNGNIFLADYKVLQGVPANKSINGKPQYLATPMCLLWQNPQNQLVPIAIQLSQIPGANSPIFLPSDSECDWLLAKIWVRNADFQVHEMGNHNLSTHLFAEVFNIATNRQLPMSHPVYKLIIPHLRYTLNINVLARLGLMGPGGVFEKGIAIGDGGIPVLVRNVMAELTYVSLCLLDDIQARGMESVPNYMYRDDGMKLWTAMERFVTSIINHYYVSDAAVSGDTELQAWVAEIFTKGFLENTASGIPSSLETKASLIKYLTMVMFRCSAHHCAVGTSQFDFYSWMPNAPSSMKSPPPTTKGNTTMKTILDALPEVNTTAFIISYVWSLSVEPRDQRQLGHYPDVHFTEETPQQFIKDFQDKLAEISKFIQKRNQNMQLSYPYLDPSIIENSVSV